MGAYIVELPQRTRELALLRIAQFHQVLLARERLLERGESSIERRED